MKDQIALIEIVIAVAVVVIVRCLFSFLFKQGTAANAKVCRIILVLIELCALVYIGYVFIPTAMDRSPASHRYVVFAIFSCFVAKKVFDFLKEDLQRCFSDMGAKR